MIPTGLDWAEMDAAFKEKVGMTIPEYFAKVRDRFGMTEAHFNNVVHQNLPTAEVRIICTDPTGLAMFLKAYFENLLNEFGPRMKAAMFTKYKAAEILFQVEKDAGIIRLQCLDQDGANAAAKDLHDGFREVYSRAREPPVKAASALPTSPPPTAKQ